MQDTHSSVSGYEIVRDMTRLRASNGKRRRVFACALFAVDKNESGFMRVNINSPNTTDTQQNGYFTVGTFR